MTRARLVLGLAAISLIGLTACSSDGGGGDKFAIPGAADTSGVTDDTAGSGGGGVTMPDITLPGELSDDCKGVYAQFLTAISSAMVPGSDVDFDKVFGAAKAQVPADLQDDVDLLANAMKDFAQILKDNNNDMSSADVQAALQALGTPEVQAASDNIQAYFDASCPG